MTFQIKNRQNINVLFECEAVSLKIAVEIAVNGGADLRGADLRGAKEYSESHDMFQEIIRRQKADTFTTREWECIAHICIYRICWNSIKKRFGAAALRVFKKLDSADFGEYLTRYNNIEVS